MEEVMEHGAVRYNTTTGSPAYFVLIPFVLFAVVGCVAVMVVCIRRNRRLDDLRHRLIPLYTYDATEQEEEEEEEDWGDAGTEEELTEPLCKEGKLSFPSGYGS